MVRGQQQGSDSGWASSAASIEGRSEDPEVQRYRPLLIVAEGQVDTSKAQERARFESAWRAARGTPVRVAVPGWTQGDGGPIWEPGLLVPVNIPSLRVLGDMRIGRVRLARSKRSTSANLELLRPDAFIPKPLVDKEQEPSAGWGGAAKKADAEDTGE